MRADRSKSIIIIIIIGSSAARATCLRPLKDKARSERASSSTSGSLSAKCWFATRFATERKLPRNPSIKLTLTAAWPPVSLALPKEPLVVVALASIATEEFNDLTDRRAEFN